MILELVGAPNLPENLQALATGGRIAVIGVGAGASAEINLLALMGKRARIHGSTLRARPLEEKAIAARLLEHEVLPLFETRRAARARRRDVPARATPPPPTSASPPAASSARSCCSPRSRCAGARAREYEFERLSGDCSTLALIARARLASALDRG